MIIHTKHSLETRPGVTELNDVHVLSSCPAPSGEEDS